MMDTAKDTSKDSRQKLLTHARHVFAQHGYDGATVKDLADAAGVNISLVSYYFGGKEGLYKACLDEPGQDRLAMTDRILKSPESLADFKVRLTVYIEEFISYNLAQKDLCTILHRDCFISNTPIAKEVLKETFLKAHDKLCEFFRQAQAKNIIRAEVDPALMNHLFFGALKHVVHTDPIAREFYGKSLDDREYREALIEHAVHFLIGGFLTPTA